MTQYPDLFAALAAAFDPIDVRARTQAGRQLSYVTARTVMNRLDDVLGPENWWDRYTPLEHSVICELTIRLPDGTILTKSDAGGYAGMADPGDDEKSGFADAFKRAAVKFGVGRYLYRNGVPGFVQERHAFPELPGSAPSSESSPLRQDAEPGPAGNVDDKARREFSYSSPPRSGKALFAWSKAQDEKFGCELLKHLYGWGRGLDFPNRMVEWNSEQVNQAYTEACRKLKSIQVQNGQSASLVEALSN